MSNERVPTGVAALDSMLDGGGYYGGSSVMVLGTAGTGKSSLAALFADASCRRKERTLYFVLEESAAQVCRNMRSIGLDLEGWQRKQLLHIRAQRPTVYGLEMHLVAMHRRSRSWPRARSWSIRSRAWSPPARPQVKWMLVWLFDYLKLKQITCLVTSLTTTSGCEESTVGISSLIDSWFQVRDIEIAAERTRGLYLVKSRGMGHSNQVREFVISSDGVDLADAEDEDEGKADIAEATQLEQRQVAARSQTAKIKRPPKPDASSEFAAARRP